MEVSLDSQRRSKWLGIALVSLAGIQVACSPSGAENSETSADPSADPVESSVGESASTPSSKETDAGANTEREPTEPAPIASAGDPGCGLETAAFCEDFERPAPGGRGGDLDEQRWAFSRWGHDFGSMFQRNPASQLSELVWDGVTYPVEYPATLCGEGFENVLPPDDVVICDGPSPSGGTSRQLNEVFHDAGDFGFNSMRIRQPFDFSDRSGKIVWEVDAKINPVNIGHGWWFEMWITPDPAPMPYHGAPTVMAYPRKGIGLALQFAKGCEQTETKWQNMLETVHIVEDYHVLRTIHDFEPWGQCFEVADGELNRFELEISRDSFTFRASNRGQPDLTYEVSADGLDLSFERGYVHFQHAQYNAHKDGYATPVQTFRWDNIGFDGPVLGIPRSYESLDEYPELGAGVSIGYNLSNGETATLHFDEVDLQGATRATLGVSLMASFGQTLEYRLNDGAWHEFEIPLTGEETVEEPLTALRALSFEIPLEELLEGENSMQFRIGPSSWVEGIGNVELLVETN